MKRTKTRRTWIDDKRDEFAAMDSTDLDKLQKDYEGCRYPSDYVMECAILLRVELASREDAAARSLGLV